MPPKFRAPGSQIAGSIIGPSTAGTFDSAIEGLFRAQQLKNQSSKIQLDRDRFDAEQMEKQEARAQRQAQEAQQREQFTAQNKFDPGAGFSRLQEAQSLSSLGPDLIPLAPSAMAPARGLLDEFEKFRQTQGQRADLTQRGAQVSVSRAEAEIGKVQAEANLKQLQATGQGRNLTAGQKKADEAFGKEYVDWIAKGGKADVEKNLAQLAPVLEALGGRKDVLPQNITGGGLSFLPFGLDKTARELLDPKSIAAQEQVEEVVQRNLRVVLGAQFTEKEGKMLIERAFNPRLDESENLKRLTRLINQIRSMAEAKDAASKYFEQNGTLVGYRGEVPDVSKLDPTKKAKFKVGRFEVEELD